MGTTQTAEPAFTLPSVPVSTPATKTLARSVLNVIALGDMLEAVQEKVAQNSESDHAIALARIRGDMAKPAIQAASGPSISTAVAARMLGRSSEHIRNLIVKDKLVGFPALGDRTRFLVPLWQFATENAVHPWVPELIRAYGSNGWGLLNFVTVPRTNLDGDHHLHLLQTGRVDEVLAAARRSNPD